MRLILASASPRRAELLRQAGFDFDVDPADLDESVLPNEAAEAYVLRVAREKARHVAARQPSDAVVLGADTTVVVDGEILGKPADRDDAARMLRRLSGREHAVVTGVVVLASGIERSDVVTTRVRMIALGDDQIKWYVATGEPDGKAGAYAIQGRAARFIDRIDGSWSNVVGLPIAAVARLLE
jgi:septum formation protein